MLSRLRHHTGIYTFILNWICCLPWFFLEKDLSVLHRVLRRRLLLPPLNFVNISVGQLLINSIYGEARTRHDVSTVTVTLIREVIPNLRRGTPVCRERSLDLPQKITQFHLIGLKNIIYILQILFLCQRLSSFFSIPVYLKQKIIMFHNIYFLVRFVFGGVPWGFSNEKYVPQHKNSGK